MGLLALAIAMVLAMTPSPAQEMPLGTVQATHSEQPGYTVMLNCYAPEDWNGGYGHYDLSFFAPPGNAFRCILGETSALCSEITLSYGAMDGDLSPARVHLYTAERSDHLPEERMIIYDGLNPADFNAFMAWFMHDFAEYAKEADDHHVFSVLEDEYAIYSLEENRTCLTAAIRMALAIPGVKDGERNPCAGLAERLVMGMKLY